jgi:hypothetical protein
MSDGSMILDSDPFDGSTQNKLFENREQAMSKKEPELSVKGRQKSRTAAERAIKKELKAEKLDPKRVGAHDNDNIHKK